MLVGPTQVPNVGVIVIVPMIAPAVAFVAVKAGTLPVPLAPKPIAVFEFVHANVAPAGVLAKEFNGAASPGQKVKLASGVTTGNGFTVIVKLMVAPTQVPIVGVAVMVLVIGPAVAFVAVNAGMFPLPFAASPIPVLELVHVKVAPAGVLANVLIGTASPAQNVKLGSGVAVGKGFTVIVKLLGAPTHVPIVGVTVIVAVIGPAVALVAPKAGILPDPLAPNPIPVLELVHVNVAPAGVLANEFNGTTALAQKVKLGSATKTGCGLIVIVKLIGGPTQAPSAGVTVIVAVIGPAVALVAVKAGKPPVPLAASPIAVLEFVHVNVAPTGVLTNPFAGTAAPAQYVKFASGVTTGGGFTVTVTV